MPQQKIRIRLKSYDHQSLDKSAKDIVDTVERTGATITGPVPLPTEKNVYTVIRSPFKDKDSREHFEIRTHKRLIDIHSPTPKTVVTGVEMFNKTLDYAQAGDNAGALLRGTKREEVERGQVLAKPGSITPHTHFNAEVYVLSKDEGGRHTPFFNGYRPQFYFRTTDVTGSIKLPEGQEMVMPGDNTNMEIELIQPIAMDQGLRFAIREGSRTVGAGVVTEIIK